MPELSSHPFLLSLQVRITRSWSLRSRCLHVLRATNFHALIKQTFRKTVEKKKDIENVKHDPRLLLWLGLGGWRIKSHSARLSPDQVKKKKRSWWSEITICFRSLSSVGTNSNGATVTRQIKSSSKCVSCMFASWALQGPCCSLSHLFLYCESLPMPETQFPHMLEKRIGMS